MQRTERKKIRERPSGGGYEYVLLTSSFVLLRKRSGEKSNKLLKNMWVQAVLRTTTTTTTAVVVSRTWYYFVSPNSEKEPAHHFVSPNSRRTSTTHDIPWLTIFFFLCDFRKYRHTPLLSGTTLGWETDRSFAPVPGSSVALVGKSIHHM